MLEMENGAIPFCTVLRVSSVWVLDAQTMTVAAKAVKVQQVLDDGLLVSGLQSGDEVVSAGAHALTPGQTVKRFNQ